MSETLEQKVARLEREQAKLKRDLAAATSQPDPLDRIFAADRERLPSASAQIRTGHDVQHEKLVREVAAKAEDLGIDISGGCRGLTSNPDGTYDLNDLGRLSRALGKPCSVVGRLAEQARELEG